jgi:hypothetical protein
MRALLTFAAAAVAALGGTTAPADAVTWPTPSTGAAGPPIVHVVWTDPQQVLPFSPRHVAEELERMLGDMGIGLSWSAVPPAEISGPTDFRVVLLAADRRLDGRPLLGATRPGPPPTIWLLLGSTRSALGLDVPATRTADVSLLSRALSRVIVHELVHAVAPEHPHAGGGLMSVRVSRGLLLGQGVQLDPPAREALLSGLAARGPAAFPPQPPSLVTSVGPPPAGPARTLP